MKDFKIDYRPEVFGDFKEIPKNIQKRIIKAIEQRLMSAPRDYGIRLAQSLSELWKLRVGDYRVIFEIVENVITIWAVIHRKKVYKEMVKRFHK